MKVGLWGVYLCELPLNTLENSPDLYDGEGREGLDSSLPFKVSLRLPLGK